MKAAKACPYCHRQEVRSEALQEQQELRPGGLIICMGCFHLAIVDSDLTRRKLRPEEYADVILIMGGRGIRTGLCLASHLMVIPK